MSDTFKSWFVANMEIVFIPILILIQVIGALVCNINADDWWNIIFFSVLIIIISIASIKRGFIGLISWMAFILICFVMPEMTEEELEIFQPFIMSFHVICQHLRSLLVFAIIAFSGGVATAIYAYKHFDEVISRRFLYRNSNVAVFQERWRYTFNRQFAGFMLFFGWFIEIVLVFTWPA